MVNIFDAYNYKCSGGGEVVGSPNSSACLRQFDQIELICMAKLKLSELV